MVVLLLASVSLFAFRLVTVKMLPYDNKSEVQVVIDMPEGTSLEETAAVARSLAAETRKLPEVTDVEVYAGTSAPFNFNGLVRHYFLRRGPEVADLQVNLLPKHHRGRASHDFAKDLRDRLRPVAAGTGANVKVTEVPPGPPVLSTLVAEVYGPSLDERLRLAGEVRRIFEDTPGVVDVDWWVEDPAPKLELVVDREKAVRAGHHAGGGGAHGAGGAGRRRGRAPARRPRPRAGAGGAAAGPRAALEPRRPARPARARRRRAHAAARRAGAGGADARASASSTTRTCSR